VSGIPSGINALKPLPQSRVPVHDRLYESSARSPSLRPGVGYARISIASQNLDGQANALAAAGCEKVFADIASGKLAGGTLRRPTSVNRFSEHLIREQREALPVQRPIDRLLCAPALTEPRRGTQQIRLLRHHTQRRMIILRAGAPRPANDLRKAPAS
jgi:hypothetical protein